MRQAGKITHYLNVSFLTDPLEKTKDRLVVMCGDWDSRYI